LIDLIAAWRGGNRLPEAIGQLQELLQGWATIAAIKRQTTDFGGGMSAAYDGQCLACVRRNSLKSLIKVKFRYCVALL